MHPFNTYSHAYLFLVRVDKMVNTFRAIRAGLIILLSALVIMGMTKTMSVLMFSKYFDTVADVTVGFVRVTPNNTAAWIKHGLLGLTASIPTVNDEAVFTNVQLLEWYDKEVTIKNTGTLPTDMYIAVENKISPSLLGAVSDTITISAPGKTITLLGENKWCITNMQPEESFKVILKLNIVLNLNIALGDTYEFTSLINVKGKQNNETSLELESPTMCYLSDTKIISNTIRFSK